MKKQYLKLKSACFKDYEINVRMEIYVFSTMFSYPGSWKYRVIIS